MRKKFNPQLLAEELKKFRMISEYSFYTGEDEPTISEDDAEEMPDDLGPADGSQPPADAPEGGAPAGDAPEGDVGAELDAAAGELGVDSPNGEAGAPPADPAAPPMPAPAPAPAPASDEVEVDVTELVQGSEEATDAAKSASHKTDQLLAQFSALEKRLSNMDAITNKIETLEKEIIKRNPTPVEKLEMRSLSSYPYSQKLTDYWAEKEGPYDVMNQEQKQEYTLTQDDVRSDYSESAIKKTFDISDYEEEDI